MNRKKALWIGASVLVLIVVVLAYNKHRMEARSKPETMNAIPVSVAPATQTGVSETLSLSGTITANNDVVVVAEAEGRVTHVYARVGDRVRAGQPLVQIDDELKKAAYETAQVNYEKATKDFSRFESLRAEHAVTDQQYETSRLAYKAAENQFIVARRQYADTKVSTPISGIVAARYIDVGTMVPMKTPVANVVDISTLKAVVRVAESDVFALRPGKAVRITTEVYPGVTFQGKVSTVSAKSDEAHTYAVEVSLPNSSEHPLKAGMFARLEFPSLRGGQAMTVPRSAIVGSIRQAQVYVVKEGIARLRSLVVEGISGDVVRVRSGLTAGEQVVTNGQNNLRDNIAVTIVK